MGDEMGTIRIPRDEWERHNEQRRELGVTWAEYIDGEAPTINVTAESIGYPAISQLRDELREIVREEVRNAIEEVRR